MTKMTSENVIMVIVKYLKMKGVGDTVGSGNINALVKAEKARGINRPTTRISESGCLKIADGFGISGDRLENV